MKTGTYALALGATLLAAAYALQKAQDPLPAPYATESSNNRPRVIERPDGIQLKLPEGFKIEEFATGFEKPRYMIYGPSGELLLSDSSDEGKVYILFDKDKDFKVEDKKVLIGKLGRPFGMAFWKDYLYVAETTSVKRYKYDRKTMAVAPGEEVVRLAGMDKGHWTRSILFDRKGTKFYLGVGSSSNVSPGDPEVRAAISRFNPDGSGKEIFAAGTRNPIGLDWYPGTDTLWAAVQERDDLGDDLVPDYFTHIEKGGFYGWPWAYIGPNEDPRLKGQKPDLVKKTIQPDVPLQAHVAVLDARFYTGKQFPKEYHGGAFIASHGSWNRSKRIGYSVLFLPFKDGKPTGEVQQFLTGFMLDPAKVDVWGRPVGLLQLTDGSLLVSDDGGNKIWRVSYSG